MKCSRLKGVSFMISVFHQFSSSNDIDRRKMYVYGGRGMCVYIN